MKFIYRDYMLVFSPGVTTENDTKFSSRWYQHPSFESILISSLMGYIDRYSRFLTTRLFYKRLVLIVRFKKLDSSRWIINDDSFWFNNILFNEKSLWTKTNFSFSNVRTSFNFIQTNVRSHSELYNFLNVLKKF